MLTTKIQKIIANENNRTWQQKPSSIKNVDPTLWQTYKLIRTSKTKYPILQDTSNNTTLYTDHEKAEGFAQMFEQVHLRAYHTHSPIQQEIENQASLITEHQKDSLFPSLQLKSKKSYRNYQTTKLQDQIKYQLKCLKTYPRNP